MLSWEPHTLISGIYYSDLISLNINSDIVLNPIIIEEEDCYNIYTLWPKFQNIASDFCKSETITIKISNNDSCFFF